MTEPLPATPAVVPPVEPLVEPKTPLLDFLRASWAQVLKEPAQAVALGYFWLTAIGYGHLFAAGVYFDINVLDYASPSDFLTAGVRDPIVPVLALASGLALLKMWMKGQANVWWRWAMVPAALAFLVLDIWGNAHYRHSVVDGCFKGGGWAPRPSDVTMGDGKETLKGLRLVAATGEFLIWYREGRDAGTPDESAPRVFVLPRHEVQKIEVPHRHRPKPGEGGSQ